jgi:thymidylate synthase (FAD)
MTEQTVERLNRPFAPALDRILGDARAVEGQPHSFVRLIDYMGNEDAIVQAARVSYGEGTKSYREDRGLIRYLMRHMHTTPFEMCEIKLHVKVPMAIGEQWLRHRTASVNKVSGRYSIMPDEFFIPAPQFIGVQSVGNRQGRDETLSPGKAEDVLRAMNRHARQSYDLYEMLARDPEEGGEYGLSRELARLNLPANLYTEFYWKIDLHNLLHFLNLRLDPHAQTEIRQVAEVIANFVVIWLPNVWQAFEDFRLKAHTFSQNEMNLIEKLIGKLVERGAFQMFDQWKRDAEFNKLSARERRDFLETLGFESES